MRKSGILMHISSLPSDYGIGTMGKEAYKFVDFLEKSKQSYWQILPLCPTSYGDSPYQSFSTHAGNPYFIDLDLLCKDGLLQKNEYSKIKWDVNSSYINYEIMYKKRFSVLKKAFERFKIQPDNEFNAFLENNENWISNYALFMTIKNANDGKSWLEWDENLRRRDPHALWVFKSEHEDEVVFWEFLQYEFFKQWKDLKKYANDKGIDIIGDIPIYVALDSADVWVYPDLFELDEDLIPTLVAGCPPDAFSPTGQLWGNPIYKWSRHRDMEYNWWIDRIQASMELYDVVRIDHFRGFESYYTIKYGDKTAENGKWQQGPGIEFFNYIKHKLGKLPIIAEDLGFLTDSVREMLKQSGFPGMKVMEFAFDPREESDYLPYNYDHNCVVYAGTHDNDTIIGWMKELDNKSLEFCEKFIGADSKDKKEFLDAFIRTVMNSVADTAIIQIQDYLGLGSEARMNIPSTLGDNWKWRVQKDKLTDTLALKIAEITRISGRCKR